MEHPSICWAATAIAVRPTGVVRKKRKARNPRGERGNVGKARTVQVVNKSWASRGWIEIP
jgi:hypothetical protein